MPICRLFSAGATGLEPATSGVTGRSRWFGVGRHGAGICRESRTLRPLSRGDCRASARAPGHLLRDGCGMCRCHTREQADPLRGAALFGRQAFVSRSARWYGRRRQGSLPTSAARCSPTRSAATATTPALRSWPPPADWRGAAVDPPDPIPTADSTSRHTVVSPRVSGENLWWLLPSTAASLGQQPKH
jgi:hypothetical protein